MGHNGRVSLPTRNICRLVLLPLLLLAAGCDDSTREEDRARAARFTTSTKPAPNPQRESLNDLIRKDHIDPGVRKDGPRYELYSEYKGEDIRQVTGVSGRKLLLVFTAPWCRHSANMRRALRELAESERGNVQVIEVNADEYSDLANRFGITAVPTTVLYTEGVKLRTFRGAYPVDTVRRYLRQVFAAEDGSEDSTR